MENLFNLDKKIIIISSATGLLGRKHAGAIFNHCNEPIKQFCKIDGLINNSANNLKVEDNGEKKFSLLENSSFEIWNHDIAVGLASVLRGRS